MADLETASADRTLKAMNRVTMLLVGDGLVDDQVVATKRTSPKEIVVGPANQITAAVLTRSKYPSLYSSQLQARCFNVRMLDGALVQMSYTFQGRCLTKHRLAYLPSPDFEPFQNDPDLFLGELLFSEIVGDQASPVPLRFDYDLGASRPGHPASHLTIGQYRHCRIPLTGPMGPTQFLRFLIEHFYTHPDHATISSQLTPLGPSPRSITPLELSGLHISIP